jgi:chromosome segregation ATPase
MKRSTKFSKDKIDPKKSYMNYRSSSKKNTEINNNMINRKASNQKNNTRYESLKSNQNQQNDNLRNSSNKYIKINSSSKIVITSVNKETNENYSKLIEEDKKKIDDLKDKLVRQRKLLEDRKKELNEIKEKNEKMKDNIYRKNKELEKIKKEKAEYGALNENLNNKINEITQVIDQQRERQVNLLQRREMMMNYLMSMILRRSENNYPNVDNMSYEELLALEERMGNVKKGLTKEQIEKLPKDKYVKNKFIEDKCIICQYEFKNYEKLIVLACKHCFHPDCISQWLENKTTCPYCKGEIKV